MHLMKIDFLRSPLQFGLKFHEKFHDLMTSTIRSEGQYWAHSNLNQYKYPTPGPTEPRNIQATLPNLLCIARKYLSALADLLMTSRLS